jgi:thiamine kinase-like enzyme
LPLFGVPTPRLLGYRTRGEEAAVVCEKVERTAWEPDSRRTAARLLARLHILEEGRLSEELRALVRRSDPRENRTTGGEFPRAAVRTLVHGDFFSANILPSAEGLRIIDWETFGVGDPMWDLGFLIGADGDLPPAEVEAVVAEYAQDAPVDRACLKWHQERWEQWWQQRKGASAHAKM